MEDQGLAVRIPQPVEEGTDPGNGGEGWQCPKRNAAGRKVRDGSGHEGTVSGERNRAYPGHLRCLFSMLGILNRRGNGLNRAFVSSLFEGNTYFNCAFMTCFAPESDLQN